MKFDKLKLNFKDIKNDEMKEIVFYSDKNNKIIQENLFTEIANKWACYVNHPDYNKPTQIRKFYDFTKKHIAKVKRREKNALTSFRSIKPKIVDVKYKKESPINYKFYNFILFSLEKINDEKDLIVFGQFFEAFMGFYTLYNKN